MLPFKLLYLFSDFTYLIVYYIIGYRKKTVRENLAMAMPHISAEERLIIEKKSLSFISLDFYDFFPKKFLIANVKTFPKNRFRGFLEFSFKRF